MSDNTGTILLIGNPNVGKSVLFNRLTGADAVVSNYPGTTVDYTMGKVTIDKKTMTVIDVPGAYSLKARDRAEEVAVKMLREHPRAVVIIVLDATRIERGLYIALETLEMGYPAVVVLNMTDIAKEKQILADAGKLQKILGVPVVATSAISGEGVKNLGDVIRKAQIANPEEIKARAEGKEIKPVKKPGCAGCGGCGGCGGI
ncbi:GTP-binding protein [Methanoplanus sp. FWC-SCC4]|uniref:GTP-binding protein n=1 Tax=Methanochimaera problematica TaxID=2609417 RepID=A0AA97FCK3_9EURY|nr:FeoB small GTPase domain-containing protein [Methanoplanus sp. FWC-SCC4]WOF16925.1 GTP-binding protein [Methanoplanus sp. FWC-SCC4]